MSLRRFALVLGLMLLIAGAAGFVPWLVMPADDVHGLSLDGGMPLLFGWFGATVLNNMVRFVLGLWGIWSARSAAGAGSWARKMALIFAGLTIAGCVPGLDSMFGVMALYGNDIWLDAILCLLCAYFGWIHYHREPPPKVLDPRQAG
jgi:hypothetical protein